MLVISCHADTCFINHQCFEKGEFFKGYLDNFVGVYSLMKAYFSGELKWDFLRIELTYGEEDDFAGAYKVLDTLKDQDVVIVLDVTGTETEKDFVIEKCQDKTIWDWIEKSLADFSFDIYENCPDPIADEDEVDVYFKKFSRVFFLGIPCLGGDYNEEMTLVKKKSIETVSQAICRLAQEFPVYCKNEKIPVY